MKTLNTFTVALMIILSLNAYADDKLKMTEKNKNSFVAVAPFIWGDPDAEPPLGLRFLKAKNALIPVAPFVWGNPEEDLNVEDKIKLLVPQAPFIWGDPDAEVPEELNLIKTLNAEAKVDRLEWESPDKTIQGANQVL